MYYKVNGGPLDIHYPPPAIGVVTIKRIHFISFVLKTCARTEYPFIAVTVLACTRLRLNVIKKFIEVPLIPISIFLAIGVVTIKM
jgi:hypothetical protein